MNTTTKTVKVTLARPGARACGEYVSGKEYAVEISEAVRLVSVKGFKYVAAADEKAAKKWMSDQAVLKAKTEAEEKAKADIKSSDKTGES